VDALFCVHGFVRVHGFFTWLATRQDDGDPRALRRRVTLISGDYRGEPRQRIHDREPSRG
jgi:hypothetical protein